jgi:hypothetical protein
LVLAGLMTLPAAAGDTPADLVRKLGHPEFRVREAAAATLVRLGATAVPALTEGSGSPDAEVAEQCKKLLPQAEAADRAEGLAALVGDPKAPPPKRLPGVESFLKAAGDTKAARELYADLLGEHPDLMVARERDPKAAGDLFYRYGEDLNARFRQKLKTAKSKYEGMVATPTDLALFLAFAADPRVNQAPRHHVYQNMLVLSTTARAALTEGDQAPALRGLFVHWLLNEPVELYQRTGFELAAEVRIPELLPRAAQLIADKGTPPKLRAMAMTALLQGGTKDHLRLLAPHLDDKTEVSVANMGGGRAFHTQVRDVALGMSVRLAGEREEDFGLGDRRFGGGPGVRGVPICLYYYGFTDDKSREEAHRKWREWVRKNPAAAGGGPAKE